MTNTRLTAYDDCRRLALSRHRPRRIRLANNTYLETWGAPDWYGIRLHDTVVVRHYQDGSVSLDAGMWHTVTTKNRMNSFTPTPLRVYQERGVWYVADVGAGWDNADRVEFANGIRWHPETGFRLPLAEEG